MKFALVLGLCLAFAFVVESFEEEAVLEGEQGKQSFEDEAVLADERGKESFEDEAVNVFTDEQGKQSFEDEAVLGGEQGKQSFEDEAVLEGERGNKSFEDEAVLADEQGKQSFEEEAVLADERGKESFEDGAVLEGEQGNDKRRFGPKCTTDANCKHSGECCFMTPGDLLGVCRPCRRKSQSPHDDDELGKESFEDEAVLEDEQGNDKRRLRQKCRTHADCDRLECCGRFGRCVLKIGPFCRPKFCKTDADCARGECCHRVGLYSRCRPKRGLFQFCHPKSTCLLRCQDYLECRFFRCLRPIPPTPTTVVPTTASA
ncbi:uncharacterized protein LOC144646285 isoform X2 [Oculina patagonica]